MNTNLLTLNELEESLKSDYDIINHLYDKIPTEALDYRPTEKQRSTQELLKYLSSQSLRLAEILKRGKAISEEIEKTINALPEFEVEKFKEQSAENNERTLEILRAFTTEELEEELDLFGIGVVMPRRIWMTHMYLKFPASYKMQLFLYLKAYGVTDITTPNLWMGMDMPKG